MRLAAHRNRRGQGAAPESAPVESRTLNSSRAAMAAARVAARYAQAPSYSEMQATDAEVAVRAAQIATQVALEAQAVAEAKLASLEAAFCEAPVPAPELVRAPEPATQALSEPVWEPFPETAEPVLSAAPAAEPEEDRAFGVRWEPDLPVRSQEFSATRASVGRDAFEIPTEDWWSPAMPELVAAPTIEEVEPAQPITANLIEFPRELVATRKVRPRRAEGEFAAAHGMDAQLSIFEVDPGTIAAEPEALPVAESQSAAAEWPGMQLEEHPLPDHAAEAVAPARYASALQLAPMNRRLMAAVVDGALITGLFLAAVLLFGSHMSELPPMKQIEIGSAIAWAVIAMLYQIFFFAAAKATPGMKYAGIGLCTFDDQYPTRGRALARMAAMLFSIAPMGLGIAWALFDDEQLSWHDRISKTYQRKC